jgi:hypothetical protein
MFANLAVKISMCFLIATAVVSAQERFSVETPAEARQRHALVAQRRKGVDVICHRGASEFAHENTMEAYRATFELGGDGNEIDIRQTKDGVLIVFHDDMLDHLLVAQGDVSDYTWAELRRFRFRDPGPFGEHCRIPTLVEVLDLHRKHAGLLHLDIKRPRLDRGIAELLDRMDMWDHVAYCNPENAGVILHDGRLKLRRYKAPGLYEDYSDVFPDAILDALSKPGDGVIVDDPRGAIVALGRTLGRPSREPVNRQLSVPNSIMTPPPVPDLVGILRESSDWNRVATTAAEKTESGQRIRRRAWAAEMLLVHRATSAEVFAALEERVRHRSLHTDWLYHGVDGAAALRALIELRAPQAIEMARFVLWRDDPVLEPVVDQRWKNPRAWTDFRIKMVVFPALKKSPSAATESLCREYLTLSDDEAHRLGPPQFSEAASTLLAISPRTGTAVELLTHRLRAVRGRAVLDCLSAADQAWAFEALTTEAPHALAYRVGG